MLRLLTIFTLIAATGFMSADRKVVTHELDRSSVIEVKGTSTFHDWSMEVVHMEGAASVDFDNPAAPEITRVYVRLETKDLRSDDSDMDANAYEALKIDEYSFISFDMTEIDAITRRGSVYDIDAHGLLTVAGTMKSIPLRVHMTRDSNGNVRFQGNTVVKLSEFGIEPPEFMFGTFTTGDDVAIVFNTLFTPSGNPRG